MPVSLLLLVLTLLLAALPCCAAAGVICAAAAVAMCVWLLYALWCVAGHERWAGHIDRFVHRLGL